jgi:hypothetical protein
MKGITPTSSILCWKFLKWMMLKKWIKKAENQVHTPYHFFNIISFTFAFSKVWYYPKVLQEIHNFFLDFPNTPPLFFMIQGKMSDNSFKRFLDFATLIMNTTLNFFGGSEIMRTMAAYATRNWYYYYL